MSACPLIVALTAVFLLTLFLLNKYGNWRKQHIVVTASTFVGWYFSFIIIFILPLDVSITFYNKCILEKSNGTAGNRLECEKPGGYVHDSTLLTLWRVVYWTAQLLTWIVLPLMQSYANAGDFTAGGKFKAALYNNAIYYGVYLIVFVLLLIYAVLKGVVINAEHLKVILVSASNTWGLFLLVVLLGYGLVEIPRQLWHFGSRDYRLNKTYFNIDKIATEKNDAEDTLKDIYKESRAVLNVLKNDHLSRDKAQTIVSKFPEEVINELFPNRSGFDYQSLGNADPEAVSNEKYLIRMHKRVIETIQAHHRTSAQWRSLIIQALWLEDVQQAEISGRLDTKEYSIVPEKLRFIWHIVARRPVCKVLGVLLGMMTVFILISECTFFIVHPTLSPAALVIDYAAERFHYKYTQLVAIFLISYLCTAAYYTIFRLRIYKYYHLDANHFTDENSLLFSAILLCRLTPPICLNFLGMIHLDSHITQEKNFGVETQFTKLMGHLDVIPLLAKGINIYLPMMILVFCAVTYYKLGTYVMHVIGFDQFVDDDDFTMEMVSAGKSLVNLERNKVLRAERREKRNDEFHQRLGGLTDRISSTVAHGRCSSIERQPIIEAEEANYEYESMPVTRVPPTNVFHDPFESRSHPNSANFFDDM